MRILVVEDEIKIRRGMANLIEKHTEHTVIGEAKNGEEGLEMVLKYRPDLVISDIRMPVKSGLEMIREIYEQGLCGHCVILSGYSEFEYAKQALKYGVDDYLIKPLAPEDVTEVLERVGKKIEKELRRQLGEPEKMLRDYLLEAQEEGAGGAEGSAELKFLCGFREGCGFRLLGAYTGKTTQEERKLCLHRFDKLRLRFPEQKFIAFFIDATQEFICLTQDENWEEIEAEIRDKLIRHPIRRLEWVWTQEKTESLEQFREQYQRLREKYLYGLVLGCDDYITAARLEGFVPGQYQYPRQAEQKLRGLIWSSRPEEVLETGDEFIRTLLEEKVNPLQIKEGCMNMANFLLQLAKEAGQPSYEKLLKKSLLREIGMAVTRGELTDLLREAFAVVAEGMDRREDISNYTIKRAINYIRKNYQENISLEQVADSLDITPEYLSTLFNREMGENFSVFLRKFRISHAKRLLKGTDKKIYEIAQEVGYGDPKYFNRVFKEEEGVTPKDFRGLR